MCFRSDEFKYLEAIQEIIDNGVRKGNRTGIDTISIFGMQMRYNLRESEIYCFYKITDRGLNG